MASPDERPRSRKRHADADSHPRQPRENNSSDVRYETDFRAVYARVIDSWLGADSTTILGGTSEPELRDFFEASQC